MLKLHLPRNLIANLLDALNCSFDEQVMLLCPRISGINLESDLPYSSEYYWTVVTLSSIVVLGQLPLLRILMEVNNEFEILLAK